MCVNGRLLVHSLTLCFLVENLIIWRCPAPTYEACMAAAIFAIFFLLGHCWVSACSCYNPLLDLQLGDAFPEGRHVGIYLWADYTLCIFRNRKTGLSCHVWAGDWVGCPGSLCWIYYICVFWVRVIWALKRQPTFWVINPVLSWEI